MSSRCKATDELADTGLLGFCAVHDVSDMFYYDHCASAIPNKRPQGKKLLTDG